MNINDYSYDNGFCSFTNQKADFSRYGIYLIHGENGTGKTVFLKQIVFGSSSEISFCTKEQEQAYKKDRSKLFSYVSQEIPKPYGVNAWEYISKKNKSVNRADARQYMDRFGMTDVSMEDNVNKLSGGERVKLCIISALLKATPYIFMDEPSNNLDDQSTEYLRQILIDYGKEHTVVVVTHDPRLSFDNAREVIFTDSILQAEEKNGIKNMRHPQEKVKKNVFRIGMSFQKTITNWITNGLIVFFLAAIFIVNFYFFTSTYALKSELTSDAILIYQVDRVYDELNQIYADARNLEIGTDSYYEMIEYSDVPGLAETEGIEQVFLLNEVKLNECVTALNNEELEDESLYTLSLPSVIYDNFMDETGLADIFVLVSGTAPSDGEKEICLSEQLYQEMTSEGTPQRLARLY